MSVSEVSDSGRVVIAIDPHKASWTAAVVDPALQPLATVRVPVSRECYRACGAPLTTRLRADGIEVIDVPAKLAARVRLLSRGHNRKSDDADALSVGIAALTSPTLNIAEINAATTALRAIVDHRDDLVKTRTQTVNRLDVVLAHLVPGGGQRNLTADCAAELLRGIRSHDAAAKTLRSPAADLVGELRQLDRRIAKAATDIETAVTATGTTLTQLHGLAH